MVILGLGCCILGILGSFLPVLPGPGLSWMGLLLLYLTEKVAVNYWILGIALLLTLLVSILDYTIPAKGTKRFGGTKYGIWGTNIGLLVGLFFPPFGFVLGPFAGAFIGEFATNSHNGKAALRAAFGSFVGFLASTFMKFVLCLSFLGLYAYVFFKYYL